VIMYVVVRVVFVVVVFIGVRVVCVMVMPFDAIMIVRLEDPPLSRFEDDHTGPLFQREDAPTGARIAEGAHHKGLYRRPDPHHEVGILQRPRIGRRHRVGMRRRTTTQQQMRCCGALGHGGDKAVDRGKGRDESRGFCRLRTRGHQ